MRTLFAISVALLAVVVPRAVIAEPMRVGTFEKQAIVVAYYRSSQWAEILKAKRAEQQQAKAANDTRKVAELERWGSGAQDLAHRQLGGDAPIDNILEALKPAFEEIAAKQRLAGVSLNPPAGAETVDVTAQLLDWLHADAKTRTIIDEMRRKKGGFGHKH